MLLVTVVPLLILFQLFLNGTHSNCDFFKNGFHGLLQLGLLLIRLVCILNVELWNLHPECVIDILILIL